MTIISHLNCAALRKIPLTVLW